VTIDRALLLLFKVLIAFSVGYHRNKVIIHAQLNMIPLLDTPTIRMGTQPLYIHIRVSLPHQ